MGHDRIHACEAEDCGILGSSLTTVRLLLPSNGSTTVHHSEEVAVFAAGY